MIKHNNVRELLLPDHIQFNPDTMLLHEGTSMSVLKQSEWPKHILRIFLTAAGVLGALWSFLDFFRFQVEILPLAGFILLMTAVTHLLYRIPKHGLILLLAETAVIPLLLMMYAEEAATGIEAVIGIMEEKTVYHGNVLFPLNYVTSSMHWSTPECISFAVRVMAVLLIIVLELAESSRFCFLLRFLLTFTFLETGLFFGLETSVTAVLLLMVFWIGSMVISLTHPGDKKKRKKKKPVLLARRKGRLKTALNGRHLTTEPLLVTVLVLTLLSAGLTWILTHNYVRSEEMNKRRSALLEAYHSFTIRDFTGLLSKLPFDFGPNIVSDELNLKRNADLHFDGSTVLNIEIDPAIQRTDYYLRGIVRTSYTGEGWATRTGDYRSVRKLLQQLSDLNRTPQSLWHSDHIAELRTDGGRYPVVQWKVEALHSEAFNYLPYQVMHPEGTRFLYDTEAELDSHQKYEFWTVNSAVTDWEMFSANTSSSLDSTVLEYEDFVTDYDTRLPESADLQEVWEKFTSEVHLSDQASLIDKLDAIRTFLWLNADYDTSPGECSENVDLVKWFLMYNHKGYCAHYASAGVVLCRMLGIPARYVQGYVVSKNDIGMPDGRPKVEISLPDHRAHAWAEIYVPGYGWVPYEFTEGITDFWRSTASAVIDPSLTSLPVSTVTLPQSSLTGSSVSSSSTTHTTASTAQSGSSSGGSGIQPGGEGDGEFGTAMRRVMQILLPVLLFAGAVFLWVLYHRRTVSERAKQMRHKNPNLAGTASYAFILYLLRIQHIRQGNRLHGAFAEMAEEQCELLDSGRLTEAVRIQQQAVFSRDGIEQEDAAVLCDTAETLAAKLYDSSGRFRRFFLRWVRHIVA